MSVRVKLDMTFTARQIADLKRGLKDAGMKLNADPFAMSVLGSFAFPFQVALEVYRAAEKARRKRK